MQVLFFCYTGQAALAPIKASAEYPEYDRQRALGFRLPTPASPQAVYRLAHFLDMPKLMDLALSNYLCQLSPRIAEAELVGSFSVDFRIVSSHLAQNPEVRQLFDIDTWLDLGQRRCDRELCLFEGKQMCIDARQSLCQVLSTTLSETRQWSPQ